MQQTTEEQDMNGFVAAIVGETKAMLDIIEVVKDECVAVFGTDRDYSDAIEAAEEMRSELIRGTYSRVLSALMQPPREKAAKEAAEVAASTLADRLGEQEQEQQPTRAGRGT